MAAAIPFAIKGGAMLAGSLLGKKMSGPSKQQQTAMTQTGQGATQLQSMVKPFMGAGSQMLGAGTNMMGQAGNYYGGILSNRRSARESLAPEMTTALDFYRGAENKTKRSMRGGSRDYALAELDRQKVGQMAGMLPAARANAAAGMGNLGGNMLNAASGILGQGSNAARDAAYINSGLFNQATTIQNQQQQGGKAWGGFLSDIAGMLPWGKGGGKGGSMVPNATSVMQSFF